MKHLSKLSLLLGGTALVTTAAQASTDYPPAKWTPNCGQYYTSGYGHRFHVIHDMEGYYLSTISYFQNCATSASVHYLTNAKQDTSTDAPAGEITQMVRDTNYAWHACCWNKYSTGTEHEGFASNPAWYTEMQYQASCGITWHLAQEFGWPIDRNHVVGHNQWQNSAWVTWATANLGINATCNTHTDPGPYWDWNHYMSLCKAGGTVVDNNGSGFTASANWATGSSSTDKYGSDYRYRSTAAVSDPAVWSANLPAGLHSVWVWYPQGANRSTSAPYVIQMSGGSHTEFVNQQVNGGQWNFQGNFLLDAGTNTIKLSCWTATGFIVVADAVKWD